MADPYLHQVEEITTEAAALEAHRVEFQREYDQLGETITQLRTQRAVLCDGHGAEEGNSDAAEADWGQLTAIPESPIGSISEQSFASEADSEDGGADSGACQLDWSRFDPDDIFSDPRVVDPQVTPSDVTAPVQEAIEDCPISEVHQEVMALLREQAAQRQMQNQALAEAYMKSKSIPKPSSGSSTAPYRFPISEYEEWKRIVGHWGEELLFEMWHQIPDQSSNPYVRQFRDRSRMVPNPEAETMKPFELRPWSKEETQTFLDRFMENPKDFYEISKGLPYRSTGDCVQFFYANKKSEIFGAVRRKHQLKKRRLQSESNREAEGSLLMASRTRNPTQHHMTEEEKVKELRIWILKRLDLDPLPFTEDQLAAAVQKFGALARDVGGAKPSVVGAYLLCHYEKFGLDEFFNQPTRPQLQNAVSLYEGLGTGFSTVESLARATSAPDRLPVDLNGFRETRAGTRYSHLLDSSLVEEPPEDRQKRRRHNPRQGGEGASLESPLQETAPQSIEGGPSSLTPAGVEAVSAPPMVPPMRFQPTTAYFLEGGSSLHVTGIPPSTSQPPSGPTNL